MELYTASENGGAPTGPQAAEFLARFHGLDSAEVHGHLYDFSGRDSVRHLFLVASSLDSMVVGESQISAQVKHAYQMATQQQATGPLTHAAFQAASRVAGRVASETAIHEYRVSIPSVAVSEFAGQIFERFDDKKVLIIGAGEMGEETLRYLQDQGAKNVTIVNRHSQRAEELARRRGGRVIPWERLLDELADADLAVSATGADLPIVTEKAFAEIERQRGNRPLFLLDLAVPRDFEAAIGDRRGVYLYSIDDLHAACDRNRKRREKELPKAIRIVDKETDRFMADLRYRATGPVVRQLKLQWEQPKEQEFLRLRNKLPNLDEHSEREIRRSFDRLTNKLLHPALESLRAESRSGSPTTLLDAVSRLFQFKD
jgi:glutamyl-tRNA reductase